MLKSKKAKLASRPHTLPSKGAKVERPQVLPSKKVKVALSAAESFLGSLLNGQKAFSELKKDRMFFTPAKRYPASSKGGA